MEILQVICHGVPDKRPLENGDIVNVDVSVFYKGYHGDLNETYCVGECDAESKRLVQTTAQARPSLKHLRACSLCRAAVHQIQQASASAACNLSPSAREQRMGSIPGRSLCRSR